MSNRTVAKVQDSVERSAVVNLLDLSTTFIQKASQHPSEKVPVEEVDLSKLEYTRIIEEKFAVFQMHAQLGTNFFIRFRKLYGDVVEIDTEAQTITAHMSDGSTAKFSIYDQGLAVEKEDWLDQISL